jgi:hypothetical protein
MKQTQLLLHRDYAAALPSVLLGGHSSSNDLHEDGPRRQLDEYYSYTEDAEPNDQHPVMTAFLLVILGTLVIASVVVFIIRLYRKGAKTFMDFNGDDSININAKIIDVEMEEQPQRKAQDQPVWANPAATADAYVHMPEVQA